MENLTNTLISIYGKTVSIIGSPNQLKNEKETENIINQLIQKQNFNSLKDMGKLMSFLKKDYSGEIDMGLAGKIAKLKLSI